MFHDRSQVFQTKGTRPVRLHQNGFVSDCTAKGNASPLERKGKGLAMIINKFSKFFTVTVLDTNDNSPIMF